mgnify:CR=1 FL=1
MVNVLIHKSRLVIYEFRPVAHDDYGLEMNHLEVFSPIVPVIAVSQ